MPPINVPIILREQGAKEFETTLKRIADQAKATSLAGEQLKFASLKSATQNVAVLRRDFDVLGNKIKESITHAQALKRQLDNEPAENVKRWAAAFDVVRQKADGSINTVQSLRAEINQLPNVAAPSRVARTPIASTGTGGIDLRSGVNPVGDVGAGLAGVGRGFSAVGLGAVGQTLNITGDVLDSAEGVGKFGQALKEVGLTAATVAVPTLAVSAGLFLLNKEMQKQAQAVKDVFEANRRDVDLRLKTAQDLENLSREQVAQQIKDIELRIRLEKEARDKSIQEVAKTFEDGAALGSVERLVDSFNILDQKLGLGIGSLSEVEEQVTTYNKSIAEQSAELSRLNQIAEQLKIQEFVQFFTDEKALALKTQQEITTLNAEGTEQRIKALEQERQAEQAAATELEKAIAHRKEQIAQGTLSADRIEQFSSEIAALTPLLDESKQRTTDLNQEISRYKNEVLPTVQAQENLRAAVEATNKSLADSKQKFEELSKQSQNLNQQIFDTQKAEDRRVALKAEEDAIKTQRAEEDRFLESRFKAAKAAQDAGKSQARLISIENERAAKTGEINAKFIEESLKRLTDFRRQEQRINDDFARDRIRAIEDLNDSLSDAARDRDVASFIDIQEKGLKDLRRSAEDFGVEASRRAEDFTLQEQDAQNARQKELENLRVHYDQRLQQERAAQVQSLTLEQQFANERAALQARRAAEDAARAEALRRQDFTNRLNALRQESALVAQQMNIINQQLSQSAFAIGRNIGNSILNGASGVRSGASGGARAISNQPFRGFSFDQGGVTPINSLFKVHEDEIVSSDIRMAVLNRNSSRAFEAGAKMSSGSGVPQVTVTIGAIGSVATKADIEAVRTEVTRGVVDGLRQAQMGAR